MAPRRPVITGSTLGTGTPADLPVAVIAHNPRNPPGRYDDVEELADSIRDMGVMQAIGVVRYEVFLMHYPEHEAAIGSREYVAVMGNRRLAAARLAGLTDIPVRHLDHLGRDGMFDEATLVENIHREDLAPLDEARALAALVERHGSQATVARRVGKTPGYVSQRLALLKLIPEFQKALESGEVRLEDARALGSLPVGEQVRVWTERHPEPVGPPADQSAASATVYGVKTARRPGWLKKPADIGPKLREYLTPDERAELIRILSD